MPKRRYEDADFVVKYIWGRDDCPKCGCRRSRMVSERISWRSRVVIE